MDNWDLNEKRHEELEKTRFQEGREVGIKEVLDILRKYAEAKKAAGRTQVDYVLKVAIQNIEGLLNKEVSHE